MLLSMLIKVALGLALVSPGPQIAPSAQPTGATEAATCLAPEGEQLKFLGYSKRTRFISYRYAPTGVPNSSMQGEPYSSILFLSPSGRRALLLFVFKLPDGRLEAMYDGYLMYKTSRGWQAAEGNGGPGMYKRVEKFVTELIPTHEYVLDLRLDAPESCIDQYDYEKEQERVLK